jgi:gluconolactonase
MQYEGCPNGLKIHKDGRIFVADAHCGLLCFDPLTAKRTVVLSRAPNHEFNGLNDLVFADNGDIYFTDPGESGLENSVGRVFRLRTTGEVDLLMDGLPVPNGIVLSPEQDALYLAVTRSLQVLRMMLKPRFPRVYKSGVFIQLSGGLAGPDGMAVDEAGNLIVVHAGFGTVWQFSPLGEPLARLKSCTGIRTTNVAYGGPDRKTLYITEAEQGVILEATMPVAGRPMFSHR